MALLLYGNVFLKALALPGLTLSPLLLNANLMFCNAIKLALTMPGINKSPDCSFNLRSHSREKKKVFSCSPTPIPTSSEMSEFLLQQRGHGREKGIYEEHLTTGSLAERS